MSHRNDRRHPRGGRPGCALIASQRRERVSPAWHRPVVWRRLSVSLIFDLPSGAATRAHRFVSSAFAGPAHGLAAFLLCLAPATPAHANGAYSHVHMSQIAADGLPPGELQTLLASPENRAALEAGSMFPDSGYAVSDEYGEIAHWEPFLSAFIERLRTVHGGDFSSPEAQRQVAFLLGVASHGLADQTYDTTLLARAFEVDGPENGELPVDQFADYFIVIDQDVVFTVTPWAPYGEIVPAVAAVGHTVSEATLTNGVGRMAAVLEIQGNLRIAQNLYWDAWAQYPFLGTHIYEPRAVGSLPHVAGLIAEYWQVLLDRLHARDDVDTQLVIRTRPADGELNWPVDLGASEAWSRPALWFGYAIDRDQIAPLVTLRDATTGAAVPVTLQTAYGGRERNLVFLRPDEALAYDTDYTIALDAGVDTIDGRTSTVATVFSFRTRCAPDRLADCPPLQPPLVTGPIPMRPVAPDAGPAIDAGPDAGSAGGRGGCAASPGHAGGGALFALLALGLSRRRRL
jgi:hypothetical protein